MWPTHSLLCFYDTMNRIYNIMYMNSEVQYIKEYLCKDTEECIVDIHMYSITKKHLFFSR
jgi:hypothetical protein